MKFNFSSITTLHQRHGIFLLSGVFGIVLDQVLKYTARHHPEYTYYILDRILGWEYFENPGIAFGIPVPHTIVIPLTIGIIATGLWYAQKYTHTRTQYLALTLIIAGACSNLIDRILFGITIDYMRIVTSIINLADLMVIGGVLLLLTHTKK